MTSAQIKPQLENRLPIALFVLRLGISIVFVIWAVDKFVKPEHAAAVFETFYGWAGLSQSLAYGFGILQLLITLAFVTGFKKTWSYGVILLMHTSSSVVSFRQYLAPFEGSNILFFAAWPMLAACFTLFYLRDFDTLAVIEKTGSNNSNSDNSNSDNSNSEASISS